MSATGVKIFGCPTCGFRVDTNEETCPRCGNVFQEGTLFECPFCGDLVPSGLDQCPSCHVSYSEFKARAAPKAANDSIDSLLMEIIKLEATSVREEEKRFSCPQCDLLLEGTETQCPRCRKALDVEVALQCPVCGSLVGAGDAKCAECGTAFDEAASTAASTEEAESRLDEIMSMAGPAEVEREPSPQTHEPERAREKEGGIEFASSMLGKLKEAVRIEPERRPPPRPPAPTVIEEPEPEPILEPAPVPPQEIVEEPPPNQIVETETNLQELESSAPVPPAPKKAPSGTGKKKTRKLKAKPKA